MRPSAVVVLAVVAAIACAGCADRVVTLSYVPPPPARDLRPTLTVLPFADQRGTEGDQGDALRVGGIYGGYGNRLAKVVVRQPWPPQLTSALVAECRAAGVDAVAAERPSAGPGCAAWLEGDLRNLSTEARWGRDAHVAAIVRLRAPDGRALVDKRIEVRESGYNPNNFDEEILERLLNKAFAEFVHKVATDPDIAGALGRLGRPQ